MGAFWEHSGLPWGTLWSVIRELFSGLVPGRVPRWILGVFWGALGGDVDGFWVDLGSILGVLLEHAVYFFSCKS